MAYVENAPGIDEFNRVPEVVFDGRATSPYTEWDEPNPLSVYGRSKLAGEGELDPGHAVVRTSWVCGRHGANVVHTVLRLAAGQGTRLKSARPKVLHSLGGRVLVSYAVEAVAAATGARPLLVVGSEAAEVRAALAVILAGAEPDDVGILRVDLDATERERWPLLEDRLEIEPAKNGRIAEKRIVIGLERRLFTQRRHSSAALAREDFFQIPGLRANQKQ